MLITKDMGKLIPKKEPLVKNNDTLFYLGKDDNGLKYFFDKPHFSCGWYYSVGNITVYSKNMRGFVRTTSLNDKRDFCLVESTCDLKELLDKVNETMPYLNEFKCETNPIKLYELLYDVVSEKLADIEKLIANTAGKKSWEIKDAYAKQTLDEIKDEIIRREGVIRYMLFNKVELFNGKTVEEHISNLNKYRNKFILFKIFD